MMMCPNYQKVLLRHTQLSIHPEASATSSLLGAALHPKKVSDPKLHSAILRPLPLWGIYHSEILTSSRSSPRRDPLRSKGFNSKPESPTIDHVWSPLTVMQLHPSPRPKRATLLLTRAAMNNEKISVMQSQPSSTSNHGRYNKSNTCRSCNYNNPSISPPCQHPYRVYIILLLQEECSRIPDPKSTHPVTLVVFMCQH